MDILSYFSNLLTSDEEKKSKEEFENQRKEAIEKLIKQLKEKCFMRDDEIKQVTDIIDEYLKKIDEYTKKFDYKNSTDVSSVPFKAELTNYTLELSDKIKEKIKEIMDAKLARAKKILGKE